MSLSAGTTLSKLQQIVVQNEGGGGQGGRHGSRHERLTREELSRTLDEKDEVIQKLHSEFKGAERQLAHLKERN